MPLGDGGIQGKGRGMQLEEVLSRDGSNAPTTGVHVWSQQGMRWEEMDHSIEVGCSLNRESPSRELELRVSPPPPLLASLLHLYPN